MEEEQEVHDLWLGDFKETSAGPDSAAAKEVFREGVGRNTLRILFWSFIFYVLMRFPQTTTDFRTRPTITTQSVSRTKRFM